MPLNDPDGALWTPVFERLKKYLNQNSKDFTLVICPFIQLPALEALIGDIRDLSGAQVVTRWRKDDLVSGVSDIEVFPYLERRGIPLYLHTDIHLKTFVFTTGSMIVTSANITQKGMGLAKSSNIEIATETLLNQSDWIQIINLLSACEKVTADSYEIAKKYIAKNRTKKSKLPPLVLSKPQRAPFSLLSLPALETPARFITQYLSGVSTDRLNSDFAHDVALFKIPPSLTETEIENHIKREFQQIPFVKEILRRLVDEKSVSFGLLTAWVHSLCSDKPAPYRKDVKNTVRALFEWLEFAVHGVTWDRPNYSMVLRWSPDSGEQSC